MRVYTSLTLPNDGRSVRLLTVEPNPNYNSLVVCRLQVAEIKPGLEFEALSYCWGDPKNKSIVSVNGVETPVTQNLASALHALRDQNTPRTLWVDAICIDQENLAEKAFQVPLMALIYGKCSQAVVWLGESDKNSRKAFGLVREGTKEYPRILSTVLRRPWFRRIWIVQEVSLAPMALVQCGKDIIEWDQLAAVVALIPPLGSMVNPKSDGEYKHLHPAFYPRILDSARKRVKEGQLFDLHEALRSFQPFEATMPVDKVFGMLSLLKDSSIVEVDYNLSPREVYSKVAVDILRHNKNLDLFLDCLQNIKGPPTADLPSWVPDWSAMDQPLDNPILTVTAKEVFQASCGTQLDEVVPNADGSLSLEGHIIGQIEDLGDHIPSVQELRKKYWPEGRLPHRRAFEAVFEATGILNSWKAVICRRKDGHNLELSDKYTTGEPLLDVLYHTLNMNGGPFPDVNSDEEFTKWMNTIELSMRMLGLYERIASKLPWFLVLFISGPYSVLCSIIIMIKFLRHSVIFDAPIAHHDAGRQTWVVGRTDSDLVGLFPAPSLSSPDTLPSEVGDAIVVFKGGARPYIIRRNEKAWRIVGSAYIHGIMYGASFDLEQCVPIEIN